MGNGALIRVERVSGDNGYLALDSSLAESVHVVLIRQGSPDEQTSLRVCEADEIRKLLFKPPEHKMALVAVDSLELLQMLVRNQRW